MEMNFRFISVFEGCLAHSGLVSPGARHARADAGPHTAPISWRRGPSRRLLHPGAIPASHHGGDLPSYVCSAATPTALRVSVPLVCGEAADTPAHVLLECPCL